MARAGGAWWRVRVGSGWQALHKLGPGANYHDVASVSQPQLCVFLQSSSHVVWPSFFAPCSSQRQLVSGACARDHMPGALHSRCPVCSWTPIGHAGQRQAPPCDQLELIGGREL